jgi:thioredoxin-dependent peroxiredoxin
MKNILKVGDVAPDFLLLDQNGIQHTLGQYTVLGKKVLIYFYPKDDTPGCTTEACNFRDNYAELSKSGLVVLGVSKDNVKSHKKFADKYELPFPLLSDESTEMIKSYDAWAPKKFMGREFLGILRKSILINSDGKVEKIYEDVKPKDHIGEVVHDVK